MCLLITRNAEVWEEPGLAFALSDSDQLNALGNCGENLKLKKERVAQASSYMHSAWVLFVCFRTLYRDHNRIHDFKTFDAITCLIAQLLGS